MMLLAWLSLWIPFFAALLIFFFLLNRPKIAGWLATLALFTSFGLSAALLAQGGIPENTVESSIRWVAIPGVIIEFGILLNGLSLLMLLIVTGVGSLIFLYSQEYMAGDEGYARYFAALSFFAFSMLGIVLANNLVQIFIFWELVGLSSYLLIGHWFEKPEASEAGKKAFLTTRVGDVGFLLGILLLFGWLTSGGEGTFNFLAIERLMDAMQGSASGEATTLLAAAGLLLFLGVIGKSAQFPLHVWLPDAMEGPTPVSALIHAATLVAAGVFLLARLFFIFSMSSAVLSVIAFIGTSTAFFAGTVALVQNDIKRVLAYSTLSQLGYMVAALGLSNPQAGMFHLGTHAFFKALLFLGAGSVIHTLHTQDIWKMSPSPQPSPLRGEGRVRGIGLLKTMPITGWAFLVGTLALVGIFPFSGFWSKEEILMTAYRQNLPTFLLLLLTVFLTAAYMGRLFCVAFLRSPLTPTLSPQGRGKGEGTKEPGWIMKIPLILLVIFSACGGFLPLKKFVPVEHEIHGPLFVTLLGLFAALGGFAGVIYLYRFKPDWIKGLGPRTGGLRKILEKKYYVDEFYNGLIYYGQDRLAAFCESFEKSVIVELYVNGTAHLTRMAGDFLRRLQTGRVQFYALCVSLGFTLLTYGFLLLWNR